MTSLSRRAVLAGALAAAPISGRLWAATATDARLLVVFLRGGYDAATLLVPIASDFYLTARPTLAVPRPDPADPLSALGLDAAWGLHPALGTSILPLYRAGQVAFVPFAGTDDLTRSHFETQDTIELGQDIHARRDYRSGFLARLAEVLGGARPIAFTDQLPLSFAGGTGIPNMAVAGLAHPAIDAREAGLITAMYRNRPLGASVAEGFAAHDEVQRLLEADPDRGAAPPRGFEQVGRHIGVLLRERFTLGFVDVGGWDTHVGQGGARGYLPDRLGELGRGLAALAEATGPVWQNTVVVVLSEFGRTFRENGAHGTDHGHGSVYWVLGGGLKGGRIAGEQVPVDQAHLFQNRDYPVLTDYRALFGGLLHRLYGLDSTALDRVFPGVAPRDLGLV